MLAARHIALTVLTFVLLAVLVGAGTAGGARGGKSLDRQPPTDPTNIRVTAATPDSLSLAWNASTDNVAVVGYLVHVNEQRTRLSATSTTIRGLPCGEGAAIRVVAYDAANNYSAVASAITPTAACPDMQPPSAPDGFRQTVTTQSSAVLEWRSSRDDVGVVGYGVYSSGVLLASVPSAVATLTGLHCSSVQQYQVDAVDGAGNRSRRKGVWVATAACTDTAPPSAPTDLSLTQRTQTSLSVSWQPSKDDVGVAGYAVSIGGTTVRTVDELGATVTGLLCGRSYEVAVSAFDAAGNSSSPARAEASTAPCTDSPPAPAPPGPDTSPPSMPTNLSVLATTRASVGLAWSASTDVSGVREYGLYVDGTQVQTIAQPGATASGLACGRAYEFAVDAVDTLGNRSGRASVVASTAVCADTQPPTSPTNVVASSRTPTSIALTWNPSSDNVGVTGYGLYRAGVIQSTSTQTTSIFSGLSCNTNYTLAVDAFDAAGNRSTKTTVMVSTAACADTQAPSAPSGLAATNVSENGLTLAWQPSTDNVGVVGYDVFRSETQMTTTTSTSSAQTGLACGTQYTFAVSARDAAGNSSSRTQLSVTTAVCPPASPPPPPPSGTVLFDGGFDTGNTSQWSYVHRYTTERFQAVQSDNGVTPRQGSHMARVETRYNEPTTWTTGANIAMAQRDSLAGAQLGADVYTGFAVYLPNGFPYVPNHYANNIVEWHATSGMDQAPIHFLLDGYQGGAFTLDLHTAPTGYTPIRWKFGDLVTGRWVNFVFRVKWANDNTGIIEGWMDGVKKFSYTGRTWGSAVTAVYPMAGYYRANHNANAVLYIDAFKVGTSYSSVAP